MMERERRRQNPERPGSEPFGNGNGSESEDRRQEANRLLRASSDAINRALSNDSQQFLDSNRQRGGQ